jgi:hypothetical protein
MPIAVREDFDARSMRVAAKRAKDAAQARRVFETTSGRQLRARTGHSALAEGTRIYR